MSTYFEVKLKRKGESVNFAPYVYSLCTTPARDLASNVSLKWNVDDKQDEYRYWTVLDTELLNEIIRFYEDEATRQSNLIAECVKNIADYKDMMPKASNTDIYNQIREDIANEEVSLSYAKEEKEIAEYRAYDFRKLKELAEGNTDFELVYYIG